MLTDLHALPKLLESYRSAYVCCLQFRKAYRMILMWLRVLII